MSVGPVVTKSPSRLSSSRPAMIAPLLNMKPRPSQFTFLPFFVAHTASPHVVPLFSHTHKKPYGRLWPPAAPPEGRSSPEWHCSVKKGTTPPTSTQRTWPWVHLKSFRSTRGLILLRSLCVLKCLSGHKERNAIKAGRPWQLDEPSRPTVNSPKHGERRSWHHKARVYGVMDIWTKQKNKRTLQRKQWVILGQRIVWACSRLLKHLDATVNDGAHLSKLDL